MKKAVKEKIKNSLKYNKTERLLKIQKTLAAWDYNHDLKKSSWFWTDNGNAQMRTRKENKYTFREELKIAGLTIGYWSNCTMSRHNVYWKDGLWLSGMDGVNLTFGDIQYLIVTIGKIIESRKK